METVLEELSFDADRHAGETITIDSKYVDEKLNGVIQNQNLERYILQLFFIPKQTKKDLELFCRTKSFIFQLEFIAQEFLPQQFLYFFPLPHGHGSFLPTFGTDLVSVTL